METENPISEITATSAWNRVTPLSKYLAMTLFIVMPFIGGWIGYTYAPEKVVEVEKIVFVPVQEEQSTEPVKTLESTDDKESVWNVAELEHVPFSMEYPPNWEFSCCGDTDTRSSHFFYKNRTTGEEYKKPDIIFTQYFVFDPEAQIDVPSSLSISEQFELLKNSFASEGTFLGEGGILDTTSYIYSWKGEEIYFFMYEDRMYSIRFVDPNQSIKKEFLERISANSGTNDI